MLKKGSCALIMCFFLTSLSGVKDSYLSFNWAYDVLHLQGFLPNLNSPSNMIKVHKLTIMVFVCVSGSVKMFLLSSVFILLVYHIT